MKSNFLFFLNSYGDLCQTTTPALNQFKWSREINGVPYTIENNQQIQVLPGTTTSNIIPYPFSVPVNSGTYNLNSNDTINLTGPTTGILPGQLVIGGGIPFNTTVVSLSAPQYQFTVTSANATAGDTYTNNGQTFTVASTIVAGTTLVCGGTGIPSSSGTLTKLVGAGDATMAFSSFIIDTNLTISNAATSSGMSGISIYSPASFIYMESDQAVSVIYNNGMPMELNPFEVSGRLIPGVFFLNGPAFSITVANSGIATANIFFASMG
jgi:hypothetical protein